MAKAYLKKLLKKGVKKLSSERRAALRKKAKERVKRLSPEEKEKLRIKLRKHKNRREDIDTRRKVFRRAFTPKLKKKLTTALNERYKMSERGRQMIGDARMTPEQRRGAQNRIDNRLRKAAKRKAAKKGGK